ncbi:prepilin peptidase [Protaetiibacter larvae]|uniref:Prepilin peptidase n=1 Tax=Protaetiibacter larvae TaxID=2592654 RepID=A0A5C1Y711_9MICO|nr:A24 family peptidase [Protaetiibacter larvae]QEO09228.1 prepilin peptidase [Protaetiibacter larvae]
MAATLVLGAFGSIIGSFLNVVIYRVPRGRSLVSPASACGACGHAIRWYDNIPLISWLALRGRCRDCSARISVRYPLIELATAVAFAVVAVRFVPEVFAAGGAAAIVASGLVLAAFLYLAAISISLAAIDLETLRLPNAIVLPAYLVGGVLLVAAAVLTSAWAQLATAGLGLLIMGGVYAIPALIRPNAIGGGDVKLAGVLGLFLGWLGWSALGVGIVAGFILGGLFGVALIVAGKGRSARVAFGPWMLAGAWIGVFAGEALLAGYLGLFGLTA